MIQKEDQKFSRAPILICGMHRSGTSLVAQLLNKCGLYLGEDDQLTDGHPVDNPTGYWEFTAVKHYAEELLKQANSTTTNTKKLYSSNWLSKINLEKEQSIALHILQPLWAAGKLWGWKDPRTTVLLPFWKTIFPDLVVVICIRNPLEVAFSLAKRCKGYLNFHKALALWQDYYQIFNSTIGDIDCIVTHHKSLFYDPKSELERICQFIGLSPEEKLLNTAINKIDTDLYRAAALDSMIPDYENQHPGLDTIYQQFLHKAGDVYSNYQMDDEFKLKNLQDTFRTLFSTSTQTFDEFYSVIEKKNQQLIDFQTQISNNSVALTIEEERKIQQLKGHLHKRGEIIQDLREEISTQTHQIQMLQHKILYYSQSKSWSITRPLRKVMNLLRRLKGKII